MPVLVLFSAALVLQGAVMAVDEFYFHHRRGLPRWEKIGHPLDTLTVIFVFLSLAFLNPAASTPFWFFGISAFSCFFVTKDEWIHHRYSDATEQWLHSLLFMAHPVVFFLAWKTWQTSGFTGVHQAQLVLLCIFGVYQILYWNFFRQEESVNNRIYQDLGERWYTADDDPVALLRAESKIKNPWAQDLITRSHLPLLPKEIHVLDIGCGGGFLSNHLARGDFDVTGIDLSDQSLEIARKHDSTGKVKYLIADAYRMPFSDQSFDAVACMDFLEHVNDPKSVIREAARVLKPNGLFIFHTFNRTLLAHLIVIKGVEWIVKNTPPQLHVIQLFIKPKEISAFCASLGLQEPVFLGIGPVIFSKSFFKLLFTGKIDPDFQFQIRKSLQLGYLGFSKKT